VADLRAAEGLEDRHGLAEMPLPLAVLAAHGQQAGPRGERSGHQHGALGRLVDLDRPQLRDAGEVEPVPRPEYSFVPEDAEIGGAGDDAGLGRAAGGEGLGERRRRLDPHWRVVEMAADVERLAPQLRALVHPGVVGEARGEPVGLGAGPLSRLEDRHVAGAAAEIAGELGPPVDRIAGGPGVAAAGQRHHKARCAEAALRAVAVDHRLLHGREVAVASQPIHGHDVAAIHLEQEADAGVDGEVAGSAAGRGLRHQHRAGAAVALGTHDLRADEPEPMPQEVGEREEGVAAAYFATDAVDPEDQVVTHGTIIFASRVPAAAYVATGACQATRPARVTRRTRPSSRAAVARTSASSRARSEP